MKILFIGDYSNLHATLAKELNKKGHEATVISDRCGYLGSHADIYIKREKGLTGSLKYLYQLFNLLPSIKDYDVVQFINPNFFSLRPGKIKYFFDRIKDQNNKMFLTLAGNDYFFCKACMDSNLFRFSEFKVGDKFTEFHKDNPNRLYEWISYNNRHWNEYFYEKIDGAMAILPEYDMVARQVIPEKTIFTNLPIDLSPFPHPIYKINNPIKIFIGIRSGMELQKGARLLLNIAREIEKESDGKVIVQKVSDLPLTQFLKEMATSDIVLDQLYAYSPATTALFAMSMGKPVVSGGQPEYYEYLGKKSLKPIITASPFDTDLKNRLTDLINNPSEIINVGKASRTLVEKYNDVTIVADKFIQHWKKTN